MDRSLSVSALTCSIAAHPLLARGSCRQRQGLLAEMAVNLNTMISVLRSSHLLKVAGLLLLKYGEFV